MKRIALIVACLVVLAGIAWGQAAEGVIVPVEHADASLVRSQILNSGIELPAGVDDIELMAVQNALRIWGTDAAAADMKDIIETLDSPARQMCVTVTKLAADEPEQVLGALQAAAETLLYRQVAAGTVFRAPPDATGTKPEKPQDIYIVDLQAIGELLDAGSLREVRRWTGQIETEGGITFTLPFAVPGREDSAAPCFQCTVSAIQAPVGLKIAVALDEAFGPWALGERPVELMARMDAGSATVFAEHNDDGEIIRPIYAFQAGMVEAEE